jgi:hypothetical protein
MHGIKLYLHLLLISLVKSVNKYVFLIRTYTVKILPGVIRFKIQLFSYRVA